MDKSQFTSNHVPGDPELIDSIISEIKSQGIFDEFRRDCLSDVDTKPSLQNLRTRVNTYVAAYLSHLKWSPELNKNQIREKIRKYLNEGGFMDSGVERIVDQVVNPRIDTVLVPKVEEVFYNHTGIEVPDDEESEDEHSLNNVSNITQPPKRMTTPQSPMIRAPFRHPTLTFPRANPNYFYNHPAPPMYPYPSNPYYPMFNPGVLPPKPKEPSENMTSIPLPPSSSISNQEENTGHATPGNSYDDTNDNSSKDEELKEKSPSVDERPPGVDDMTMDLDFVLPPGVDDSSSELLTIDDTYKLDAEREYEVKNNVPLNQIGKLNLDTNVNVTAHVGVKEADVKDEKASIVIMETDNISQLPDDRPPGVDEVLEFHSFGKLNIHTSSDKEENLEKNSNTLSIPPLQNIDIDSGKGVTECEKKNDNQQLEDNEDDEEISPPFEPLVPGSHSFSSDSDTDMTNFLQSKEETEQNTEFDSKGNKVAETNMVKDDSRGYDSICVDSDKDSTNARNQSAYRRTESHLYTTYPDNKYGSDRDTIDNDKYRESCDEYGRYRRRSVDLDESEDDVRYRKDGRSTHSRSHKRSKKSNKHKKKKEKYCKPEKREYRRSSDESDDSPPPPHYRDYHRSRHSHYERSSSKSNRHSSSGKSHRSKTHYEVDDIEPLNSPDIQVDSCKISMNIDNDTTGICRGKKYNNKDETVEMINGRDLRVLLRDLRSFYDIDKKIMLENNNVVSFNNTMVTEQELNDESSGTTPENITDDEDTPLSQFEILKNDRNIDWNDLKKKLSQFKVNLLSIDQSPNSFDGCYVKQEGDEKHCLIFTEKIKFESNTIKCYLEPDIRDNIEKYPAVEAIVRSQLIEQLEIDTPENLKEIHSPANGTITGEIVKEEFIKQEFIDNDNIEVPEEHHLLENVTNTTEIVKEEMIKQESPKNDTSEVSKEQHLLKNNIITAAKENITDLNITKEVKKENEESEGNQAENKEIDKNPKGKVNKFEKTNENHREEENTNSTSDLVESVTSSSGKIELYDFCQRLQESRLKKLLKIKRKLIKKCKHIKKRRFKKDKKKITNELEERKVEKILELSKQLMIETDENLKNQVFDIIGVEWKCDKDKSKILQEKSNAKELKKPKKRIRKLKSKKVKKNKKRKAGAALLVINNQEIKKPRIDEAIPTCDSMVVIKEEFDSAIPTTRADDTLSEFSASKASENHDVVPLSDSAIQMVEEKNESTSTVKHIPEFTIREANQVKYKNIRYSDMSNARSTKSGLRILVPRKSAEEVPRNLMNNDVAAPDTEDDYDCPATHFNMDDSYIKLREFEEFIKTHEKSLNEIRFQSEQCNWMSKHYYSNGKITKGAELISGGETSNLKADDDFRRCSSTSVSTTEHEQTKIDPNDSIKWFRELNDRKKAIYWNAAREVIAGKSISSVSEANRISRNTIRIYLNKLTRIEEMKNQGVTNLHSKFGKINGSFTGVKVKTKYAENANESLTNGFTEERTPEELELHLIRRAAEDVLSGMSIRKASARYGISPRKVSTFMQTTKKEEIVCNGNVGVKIKTDKQDPTYENEISQNVDNINAMNSKIYNGMVEEMEERLHTEIKPQKPVIIFKHKKPKMAQDKNKKSTLTKGSSSLPLKTNNDTNQSDKQDRTYEKVAKLVISGSISARNAARKYNLTYQLLSDRVAHMKLINGQRVKVKENPIETKMEKHTDDSVDIPKPVVKRQRTDKEEYELACKDINNGGSFRKTAKKHDLPFHSLYMYHRKRYYGLPKTVKQEGVIVTDIKKETNTIQSKNDVKKEETNQIDKEERDVKFEAISEDKKKNNLMYQAIYEKAGNDVLAGMKIEQAAFVYSIDCNKLSQFVVEMKKKLHSGDNKQEARIQVDNNILSDGSHEGGLGMAQKTNLNEMRTKLSKPKSLNQSYESSELYKPKPSFLQSFPRRYRTSTTAS